MLMIKILVDRFEETTAEWRRWGRIILDWEQKVDSGRERSHLPIGLSSSYLFVPCSSIPETPAKSFPYPQQALIQHKFPPPLSTFQKQLR